MGCITDAEFLLLYEESKSGNLDFPCQEYPTFSLPDKDRSECTANLMVEKHHITRLDDALQIPGVFKCDQGTVCDGTEAGPLYPSQAICLPLSLLRHHLDIWEASPRNLYDKIGPRKKGPNNMTRDFE